MKFSKNLKRIPNFTLVTRSQLQASSRTFSPRGDEFYLATVDYGTKFPAFAHVAVFYSGDT